MMYPCTSISKSSQRKLWVENIPWFKVPPPPPFSSALSSHKIKQPQLLPWSLKGLALLSLHLLNVHFIHEPIVDSHKLQIEFNDSIFIFDKFGKLKLIESKKYIFGLYIQHDIWTHLLFDDNLYEPPNIQHNEHIGNDLPLKNVSNVTSISNNTFNGIITLSNWFLLLF